MDTITLKIDGEDRIFLAQDVTLEDYRNAMALNKALLEAQTNTAKLIEKDKIGIKDLVENLVQDEKILDLFCEYVLKLYKNQFTYEQLQKGLSPHHLSAEITRQMAIATVK